MFQTRIIKKQLHFKQPAGTSRGVYTTRDVWYILLTDTGSRHYGVGECAPLPALSCDDIPSYDEVLGNGKKTDLFVLRNKQGNEVAVTNYGGAVGLL